MFKANRFTERKLCEMIAAKQQSAYFFDGIFFLTESGSIVGSPGLPNPPKKGFRLLSPMAAD